MLKFFNLYRTRRAPTTTWPTETLGGTGAGTAAAGNNGNRDLDIFI